MTNLNLNVKVNVSGLCIADIFILTGLNPESSVRETLGYYSNKQKAEEASHFWSSLMDYTDMNIEFAVLRLD